MCRRWKCYLQKKWWEIKSEVMPKNIKHELCEIGKIWKKRETEILEENIFDKWIEIWNMRKMEKQKFAWRRKVWKDSINFSVCNVIFWVCSLSNCIYSHTRISFFSVTSVSFIIKYMFHQNNKKSMECIFHHYQ